MSVVVAGLVLDCSVAMAWCFDDEASPATDALLDRVVLDGAVVPALWHWEVANVLNGAARRQRLTLAGVTERLELIAALPIITDPEATARARRETLLLAAAEGLTVYDAAYLELAQRTGAELATLDAALATAARQRGVVVVP